MTDMCQIIPEQQSEQLQGGTGKKKTRQMNTRSSADDLTEFWFVGVRLPPKETRSKTKFNLKSKKPEEGSSVI